MLELGPLVIAAGIIFVWTVGLATSLLIRFAFLKRPMRRWPAIGICMALLLSNVLLFTALGTNNRSHAVSVAVALISYWILRAPATPQVRAILISVPFTTLTMAALYALYAIYPILGLVLTFFSVCTVLYYVTLAIDGGDELRNP